MRPIGAGSLVDALTEAIGGCLDEYGEGVAGWRDRDTPALALAKVAAAVVRDRLQSRAMSTERLCEVLDDEGEIAAVYVDFDHDEGTVQIGTSDGDREVVVALGPARVEHELNALIAGLIEARDLVLQSQ